MQTTTHGPQRIAPPTRPAGPLFDAGAVACAAGEIPELEPFETPPADRQPPADEVTRDLVGMVKDLATAVKNLSTSVEQLRNNVGELRRTVAALSEAKADESAALTSLRERVEILELAYREVKP